jgi:hypothetical protein
LGAPKPEDGEWVSSGLTFQVDDQHVTKLGFGGWGCIGPLTDAGFPVCSSLLTGDVFVDAPIHSDSGSFTLDTLFGLKLAGAFEDSAHLVGTFMYTADNGCCEAVGQWSAVHGKLAEDEPPAVCQTEVTGEEILEILNQPDPEGAPVGLLPGAEVTAVQGFQGAIMIVVALQGSGFTLGNLTVELEVDLPDIGVMGAVIGDGMEFTTTDEGHEWRDMWLILSDAEGELLDPFNEAHTAMIQGQIVRLTATLKNPCGFSMVVVQEGVLDYVAL